MRLKGIMDVEAEEAFLDKQAMAIFRKTHAVQGPDEYTCWTRREFEGLKKSDSLQYPP